MKSKKPKKPSKPTVFIASSTERSDVVREVASQLGHVATIARWTDIFELTQPYITSLLNQLSASDYALCVFAPDDITKLRKQKFATVRDNVVLEFGMFLGRLGPQRCAIIAPRLKGGASMPLHLPSDIDGLALAEYDPTLPLKEALAPICDKIKALLKKNRVRAVQIEGDWVEIKQKPDGELPFSIVNFSRQGNSVKITGTSYYLDGRRHVTWPDKIDVCAETPTGYLHCYDAAYHSDGKLGKAHGVCSYTFHDNPDGAPTSGYGHYIAHVEGEGMLSGRVDFKLKRLTPEYRGFLLGSRQPDVEEHHGDVVRRLRHLYRTRRIVITGGPGSWKTTALAHLQKRKCTVIEEAARIVINQRNERTSDEKASWKWRLENMTAFQRAVLAKQLSLERSLAVAFSQKSASKSDWPRIYLDRSGIDGIAFLRYAGLQPTKEMLLYARESAFDAVFIFPTPAADQYRFTPGAGHNRVESVELGDLLAEVYDEFGYRPIAVPADLSPARRAEFVHDHTGA